jgi:hypothetical protein
MGEKGGVRGGMLFYEPGTNTSGLTQCTFIWEDERGGVTEGEKPLLGTADADGAAAPCT